MEQLDPAQRDRTDGVAVVGATQGHEAGAPTIGGVAGLLPELVGHLHGDLDRSGAVVAEEDAFEAGRCQRREPPGELYRGGAGIAEEGAVREAAELRGNGGIDLRTPMSEQVAPERGDAVEIAAAVGIDQPVPLGRYHHERMFVGIHAVGREWVPDVAAVGLVQGRGHGCWILDVGYWIVGVNGERGTVKGER